MSLYAQISQLILPGKDRFHGYFRALLFWNPFIAFIFSLCFDHGDKLLRSWLNSTFIATVVLTISHLICFAFRKTEVLIYKWKGQPAPQHGARWYFGISITTIPFGMYVAFSTIETVWPRLGWWAFRAHLSDYKFGMVLGTVIGGLFFLFRSMQGFREVAQQTQLKLKVLENERLQAQLSALTAQMNPHLLFNALNTVAALVPTDPEKAEAVIVKLSQLYRGVLDSSRRMSHSLFEELEICRAYLAVEQARFGERLQVSIEIDPELDLRAVQIPALSIQPLVENSVKHGLSSRAAGGLVQVKVNRLQGRVCVKVIDDGVGFGNSPSFSGAGTGLKNCEQRLKLHYGENGGFQIIVPQYGGTEIELRLPEVTPC